jgi:hypothetical protein
MGWIEGDAALRGHRSWSFSQAADGCSLYSLRVRTGQLRDMSAAAPATASRAATANSAQTKGLSEVRITATSAFRMHADATVIIQRG